MAQFPSLSESKKALLSGKKNIPLAHGEPCVTEIDLAVATNQVMVVEERFARANEENKTRTKILVVRIVVVRIRIAMLKTI